MLQKLKGFALYLLAGIGSLILIIFGLKMKKLETLEAEKRARSLEDDVKGLRDEIANHKGNVAQKEKELREKIAAFKHQQRQLNSPKGEPDDAA